MLTLCLDTSYKHLSCALIEDEKILCAHDELCFKRQSERLFVVLNDLLQKSGHRLLEIDSLCITEGPGSYTGVRIAMTLAKTLATLKNLRLYTISTLRLYAAARKDVLVLMDARAGRAYNAIYSGALVLQEDSVCELSKINLSGYEPVGDASLFGGEDNFPVLSEAFLACKPFWNEVSDIHHLIPKYLKESEDYYR